MESFLELPRFVFHWKTQTFPTSVCNLYLPINVVGFFFLHIFQPMSLNVVFILKTSLLWKSCFAWKQVSARWCVKVKKMEKRRLIGDRYQDMNEWSPYPLDYEIIFFNFIEELVSFLPLFFLFVLFRSLFIHRAHIELYDCKGWVKQLDRKSKTSKSTTAESFKTTIVPSFKASSLFPKKNFVQKKIFIVHD